MAATLTQKRLPLKRPLAHKTPPLATAGRWLDGQAPGLPSWVLEFTVLRGTALRPHASGVPGRKRVLGTAIDSSPSEVPGDRGVVTAVSVCHGVLSLPSPPPSALLPEVAEEKDGWMEQDSGSLHTAPHPGVQGWSPGP